MEGEHTDEDVTPPGRPGWSGSTIGAARPNALALGGVLLAVVLLVVGYVVLRSDSDDDTATDTTVDESDEPGADGESEAGGDGSNDATDANPDDGDGSVGPDDGYTAAPWSLIASFGKDIASFPEPGAESDGKVAAKWHGRQSVLPVIEERPKWLRVRLPQRPNGLTTWVRRRDVELASTPYRIRIDVATTRLQLYKEGELIMDAPAGVGTDDAPTTVGEFFLTFFQEPFDDGANWGPFIMVTSAHSETISDFQSSGDAIAAIHGPLGGAQLIGDTGAKVSKGCVRLHTDDLKVLRDVPAGSPIDVTDSSQSGTTA